MDLFPFEEVRDKQSDLLKSIEETVSEQGSIIAHAPTGLGKTAASVTPAIKEALENDRKVFFLTPRHSQHEIALETVKKINERHDKNIVSVDLIGKSHLCEADAGTRAGDGPDCPRYEDTYTDAHELTKQAKSMIDRIKHQNLSAEEVKEKCNKVCPYEILTHMTSEAEIVIADYFHVFHPKVREVIFEKADIDLSDSIIIVDEAHNLPSRTRSLFTASLSAPKLDDAITECEAFGFYNEGEQLERLKSVLTELAAEKLGMGDHETEIEKEDLKEPVESIQEIGDFVVELENVAEEVQEEQESSHCASVAEFLDSWTGEDRGFIRFLKRERTGSNERVIKIKYSCLDPQISTKKPLNDPHSSILMSGTLTPQEMYADLLGIQDARQETFDSPFPEENELNLVVPTLTSKYSERDDDMIQKYAWYLKQSFEAVDGNCGVFFPSYKMMHEVKQHLRDRTDRKLFTEERRMDKEEKQNMFDEFASTKGEGNSVLLGVAAGSFGEGVDYPGEILKAVFIAGIPLKKPDIETKGLIDFLDEKFGRGWDYGYSYPAMNRAIQAAGRCIRSSEDRGVIVYMDERYDWSNYRKVFPSSMSLKTSRAPWKEIEKFFEK
jgi:DNA excision repair protein ERCC-2